MDTVSKVVLGVVVIVAILVGGSIFMQKTPRGLPPISNGPPVITMAEYERVHEGMTYSEVVGIIGSEGRVVTELIDPSTEFDLVTRAWDNPGKSFAQFTFDHGVVSARLQVGLP